MSVLAPCCAHMLALKHQLSSHACPKRSCWRLAHTRSSLFRFLSWRLAASSSWSSSESLLIACALQCWQFRLTLSMPSALSALVDCLIVDPTVAAVSAQMCSSSAVCTHRLSAPPHNMLPCIAQLLNADGFDQKIHSAMRHAPQHHIRLPIRRHHCRKLIISGQSLCVASSLAWHKYISRLSDAH
jgi:hypothetical protein